MTYLTKSGETARRRPPRTRSTGVGYTYIDTTGWLIERGDNFRRATSAEARYLNATYGHTPMSGYNGPDHPSWRPY
jgi:hypothetical protein